jgi:hypothetical protein
MFPNDVVPKTCITSSHYRVVAKTSFITSSTTTWLLKHFHHNLFWRWGCKNIFHHFSSWPPGPQKFEHLSFLNHVVAPYWIASCSLVYTNPLSPPTHCLLPDLCEAAEMALHTWTLKKATAVFARPLENLQRSTKLIPESQNNTNGNVFISWMFEWHNACLILKVTDFLWWDCRMWQSGLYSLEDIIFIFLITIYVLSLILYTFLFTVCWYYFILLYFTLCVLMLILLLRTWNVMSCILRRLLLQ